jgi:hypothetical protein
MKRIPKKVFLILYAGIFFVAYVFMFECYLNSTSCSKYYQPDETLPHTYISSNLHFGHKTMIIVFYPAFTIHHKMFDTKFYKEAQYDDGGWGPIESVYP